MPLEVNDFNAIRISLASPEQIRSWSYGEVTKPETINYRTLKPEKDGLFCEKIFGPTKDFECYCGKYKRVRYKGIVCDKCGVEVTRAKVRRERMGNIELATPVAHIWFVKGTPSRIGLLLDVSPRSLERVLYFAQYIVTSVDEDERAAAISRLNEEIGEVNTQLLEQQALAPDVALAALDKEMEQARAELKQRIDAVRQTLLALGSKPAPEDISLGDVLIVAVDEVPPPEAGETLEVAAKNMVEELEATFANRRKEIESLAGETAGKEAEALRIKQLEELRNRIDQMQEQVYDLESLKDPSRDDQCSLLAEGKFRDLQDRFSAVFQGGMGAEAVLDILRRVQLDVLSVKLREEIESFSGQRRKKATKRLRVVEALRSSGNKPEWMILTVLPVLPPDLRPMVQLDGGRFATSDLNDLYRRVINRNNRLKRLLELGAPEIIIRNEKRMLQEAVDSLIDNGRRGRVVSTAGNHKLKSLSDMLKGKQGRFRQNLLGKRVDYSGRSVIVVGPELKLHQCGVPKRMALELFKPFVMHALVAKGLAHNIKSAKRIVERARPEVWDILDEIIKQRPVLLNRAPTLHRLGIQAFEPVLIDGSAIQIHPLVCSAFNADFDGDQMAVHVPLSRASVAEARQVMLSSQNLLLPSNGEPVIAPTLDIVLGCYYLTLQRPGSHGEYTEGKSHGIFGSFAEAELAYNMGIVHLHAVVKVRDEKTNNELVETTIGRIIFNEIVPAELGFRNREFDKKAIKDLVAECYRKLGSEPTAELVDQMKNLGFHYATTSGITIGMNDLRVPEQKYALLDEADNQIAEIQEQFNIGLITEEERYEQAVRIWRDTTDRVQGLIQGSMSEYGGVYLMAVSGAKGNISQISQMAGMRGLMVDPSGRIIDLPIRSSFREGLSVLEYFISTHGARKGLADTALRTADSGYLTRRLIDVCQDVIVVEDDCGTTAGVWLTEPTEKGVFEALSERIIGRWAAADLAHPKTGEIIIERDNEITEEIAQVIKEAEIDRVYVRSPLTCQTKRGICAFCYGRDLARGQIATMDEAVGIIAAQSIGEPGTQLTMRTFHTGGVVGIDITSGLPRVEELFEARVPKGTALVSETDGVVELQRDGDSRRLRVINVELYRDEYPFAKGAKVLVKKGDEVERGAVLVRVPEPAEGAETTDNLPVPANGEIVARASGRVVEKKTDRVIIEIEDRDEREYVIPATARLRVQSGETIHAGQALTEGPLNPQDILRIQGSEAVQLYLVEEVQKVYRSQGVSINDKHIEVIIRQMLRRVRIDSPGDTAVLPGELVDRFKFEEINGKVLAEGGEPATAQPVLLGVTKASLNTESFLAAASFQETTRVLTEAAITGAVDRLLGLKENVIIGKLVPARAAIEVEELPKPKELGPGDFFADGDDAESRLDLLDRKIEAGFGDLADEDEDLLEIEEAIIGESDDILAEDAAEPVEPADEEPEEAEAEAEATLEEEEPPLAALQEDSVEE